MDIRTFLHANNIICDGAFGTYFLSQNPDFSSPERANNEAPELVKKIHKEYIIAGANLIRTNTFALSTWKWESKADKRNVEECIKKGYHLAKQAASEYTEKEIFIAGDIGPANVLGHGTDYREQYLFEANCLLESGADILVFESFSDLEQIEDVIREIGEEKKPFIMVQFCVNQYGYSASGYSGEKLLELAGKIPQIDALGFNCGIGPGHMHKLYSGIAQLPDKYLTALPNAGYPNYLRDRTVYLQNIEYFVALQKEISEIGVSILGGCCGTTPEYISALSASISNKKSEKRNTHIDNKRIDKRRKKENIFYHAKSSGEMIIAVELAPPFHSDTQKIMDAANELKNYDVDVVTFPDSPSGRTRIDSIAMAIKVFHETGINVMPHVCCRDRNTIAIGAQILGAYVNNIRNFLVITGDPVPALMRTDIKSVFNFNSVGMMQIMKEMNHSDFIGDEIAYGGALNCGCVNMQAEIDKMKRKIEAGAEFFLTQPIFNEREIENLRLAKKETKAVILCGLMPLVSKKNAVFIKNEIAGIQVTDEIINRFEMNMTREVAEEVGISICCEIMRKTKDIVDGYYFSIPFYRTYLVNKIMKQDEMK